MFVLKKNESDNESKLLYFAWSSVTTSMCKFPKVLLPNDIIKEVEKNITANEVKGENYKSIHYQCVKPSSSIVLIATDGFI